MLASAIAAGGRDPAEGRIDVAALARGGAVDHRQGHVSGVDPAARTVTLADGTQIAWDVVSFNIGSVASVPSGVEMAAGIRGRQAAERPGPTARPPGDATC